jgi:hypothetical protein
VLLTLRGTSIGAGRARSRLRPKLANGELPAEPEQLLAVHYQLLAPQRHENAPDSTTGGVPV